MSSHSPSETTSAPYMRDEQCRVIPHHGEVSRPTTPRNRFVQDIHPAVLAYPQAKHLALDVPVGIDDIGNRSVCHQEGYISGVRYSRMAGEPAWISAHFRLVDRGERLRCRIKLHTVDVHIVRAEQDQVFPTRHGACDCQTAKGIVLCMRLYLLSMAQQPPYNCPVGPSEPVCKAETTDNSRARPIGPGALVH